MDRLGSGSFKESPEEGLRATIRLLKQRLHDYDVDRARDRLGHAVVRGATAGLALRGGLHLVTYVLGLVMSRRGKAPPGSRPGAVELVGDTLRWGAFLGSFAGVYVFSDELIALLGGRRRTAAWRAFASGAAAGPTLLLTGPKARHTSLALYILLRGLALLIRCGNLPEASPLKRKLLAPTRWRHGDVALMCLSTMQIAYSWIVLPQTFPPSYNRFLNKHGGRPLHAYNGVRELLAHSRRGRGPFRLASLQGTPQEHFCGTTPCGFLHPGHGCATQPFDFFPAAYLRALPVYLPVYVVPALLVHGRRMLRPRTALEIWRKVGLGVLRSSLFLSGYCTLAWVGVCTGFSLTGRTSASVITLSAWLAGLALLFEKKSRRMELAMYTLSRVVEAFGLCLVEWGYVRPGALPQRLDVLLFSLATASICHCYSDHYGRRRGVFRSKYLTVFDFILGNQGFHEASIRHVPSNAALFSHAQLRISNSVQRLLNLAAGGGGALEGEGDVELVGSAAAGVSGAGAGARQDRASKGREAPLLTRLGAEAARQRGSISEPSTPSGSPAAHSHTSSSSSSGGSGGEGGAEGGVADGGVEGMGGNSAGAESGVQGGGPSAAAPPVMAPERTASAGGHRRRRAGGGKRAGGV